MAEIPNDPDAEPTPDESLRPDASEPQGSDAQALDAQAPDAQPTDEPTSPAQAPDPQAAVDEAMAAESAAASTDAPVDMSQVMANMAAIAGGSTTLTQAELDAVLAASGLTDPGPSFSMSEEAAAMSANGAATAVAPPPSAPEPTPVFVPPVIDSPAVAAATSDDDAGALDLINDVSLDVKVELGRSRMYVEDVLRLGAGSVVELDKLAGDPVDIFVNERLVARGEVLVLNDDFCVRISEIITPTAELAEG